MHVSAKLSSYEKVSFSLTLTAPVEDWRAAVKQLQMLKGESGGFAWPMGGFVEAIRQMLEELDKTHAKVLLKEEE